MDNVPDAAFDNLYKFAAMAGVILIVSSAWILVHSITDLWQQAQTYNIEAGELNSDLAWREAQAGAPTTSPIAVRDLQSVSEDIAKSTGRLKAQYAAIEATSQLMRRVSGWAGACAGVGLLLSGWGFYRWRWHQKLLDVILEAEAAVARQKIRTANASSGPSKGGAS